MPNKVTIDNYTSQNAKNVAYLLQDIGAKVNMGYSCNNSGAFSETARTTFVNNYGYNASNLVDFNYYTITQNINNNKPVYVGGYRNRYIKTIPIKLVFGWTIGKTTYGYSGGHDWVIDGHKVIKKYSIYSNGQTSVKTVADLIHCNWGWGNLFPKNYNGWYYHSNWHDEQNQYHYQTIFFYKKQMIHNITPKNN